MHFFSGYYKKVITRLFCLAMLSVILIGTEVSPVFSAGNTSATVEDIVRVAKERRNQEISKIPLKGFFFLCANGTADDVGKALKAGANPNEGDPEHGGTPPLTLAAGNNTDPQVIRVLLKAGASINHSGRNYKRTSLHQAVLWNKKALPVISALLEGKPDLYIQDTQGFTALDYAIDGTIQSNRVFDGKPREDVMLVLLAASKELPYTLTGKSQEAFFTGKYNLYTAAFQHGRNGGKLNPKVVEAFKELGVDVVKSGYK